LVRVAGGSTFKLTGGSFAAALAGSNTIAFNNPAACSGGTCHQILTTGFFILLENGAQATNIHIDAAFVPFATSGGASLNVTGLDASHALLVVNGATSEVFLGSSFGPQPLVIPPDYTLTADTTVSTVTHAADAGGQGGDTLSGDYKLTATGLYHWSG